MASQSRIPVTLPNGRSPQSAVVDGRISSAEATAGRMRRFYSIGMLIVAAVVAVFLFQRCHRSSSGQFQTATVPRGPITQVVTATGTLNPVVNVQVGSQVSGNIQKLFADFNSKVKAGEIVAQIDPVLFQATVTQAEGDLANAQAGLELAQANAKRVE